MRRVHLLFDGTVQGVGYRYTLQQVATAAGASGWVRNLADGRVEAEVEGAAAQLDTVLAWTEHGPRGGVVTDVETRDVPPQGGTGFEVRRDA